MEGLEKFGGMQIPPDMEVEDQIEMINSETKESLLAFVEDFELLQETQGALTREQVEIINEKIVQLDTTKDSIEEERQEVPQYLLESIDRLGQILINEMPEHRKAA